MKESVVWGFLYSGARDLIALIRSCRLEFFCFVIIFYCMLIVVDRLKIGNQA